MNIFLAGTTVLKTPFLNGVWDVTQLNVLESYAYIKPWQIKFIPKYKNFMLDSGAFTIRQIRKNNFDWNGYIDRYADFVKKNNVCLYFELDVDNVVGLHNVEKFRKRLEDRVGWQSIPVWHPNRGKEYFVRMCEEYPYIALGGLVNVSVSKKEYIKTFQWFIHEAHKHGTKIHGLGFTHIDELKRYHFDSVDSTTWLNGGKFGELHCFQQNTIVKYDNHVQGKHVHTLKISYKEAHIHNFGEWVKFSKYAKLYL